MPWIDVVHAQPPAEQPADGSDWSAGSHIVEADHGNSVVLRLNLPVWNPSTGEAAGATLKHLAVLVDERALYAMSHRSGLLW